MNLSVAALVLPFLPIRTCSVDVTPEKPFPLGGYTARKDSVSEPDGQSLYVRVTEVGDIVFVGLDGLTVPRGFYDDVQSKLHGRKLLLTATHTHCAPDTQMLNPRMTFKVPGIASFNQTYETWLREKVVEAVRLADSETALQATTVSLQNARVNLNHARRKNAKPDQTAWVISTSEKVLLASYAAHATLHEEDWNRTDGDWPGLLASRLNAPVMPGAIGDVSPEAQGSTPVEKCQFFVEKFVAAIARARKVPIWKAGSTLQFVESAIELGKPVAHPTFAKEYGVPDSVAALLVQKFAESEATVVVARIGSFVVVGVPGEPSAAVGRHIQQSAAKLGFPHCLVLSHTNGWIGYILEPNDYDRGGYEARLSFNGRETSLRVEDAAGKALQKMSTFSGRWPLDRGFAKVDN